MCAMYQPETEDISDDESVNPEEFLTSDECDDYFRSSDTASSERLFEDMKLDDTELDVASINSDISSLPTSEDHYQRNILPWIDQPCHLPPPLPNNIDRTTYEGRLATFHLRWSPLMKLTPHELAIQGFYLENLPDFVRCYKCLLGIKSLNPACDIQMFHYYASKLGTFGTPCSVVKDNFESNPSYYGISWSDVDLQYLFSNFEMPEGFCTPEEISESLPTLNISTTTEDIHVHRNESVVAVPPPTTVTHPSAPRDLLSEAAARAGLPVILPASPLVPLGSDFSDRARVLCQSHQGR